MFSAPFLAVTNKLQSPGQQRKTVVSDEIKENPPFRISKVTTVRPVDLSSAAFAFKFVPPARSRCDEHKIDDKSYCEEKSPTKRDLHLNLFDIKTIEEDELIDFDKNNCGNSEVSMEPVKRLPRASELLTMERKKSSASRESITDSAPGSTENLSEGGSQKKAKLRIPKPVKSLVSKGGKNEEKKKKEDANNNCKLMFLIVACC